MDSTPRNHQRCEEPTISRELAWLSVAYLFLFCGASHQQFLVAYLNETLGWGETIAQSVLGTVYVSFMFWRVLVGATIRRLGDYLSNVVGAATYPLFVLAVWVASYLSGPAGGVAIAFLAAAVWGWGAASMWLTSGAQVLDASRTSRYGFASGVFHASSNIGFALGVLLFDWLLRSQGGTVAAHRWRLGLTAAAMALGVLCLARLPRADAPRTVGLRTALRYMAHPRLRIAAFLMAASSVGFGLMLSVFPAFIRETLTHPLLSTAAFFPLARALLSLTGSPASDKWGRGAVLFVSFGIGAAGLGAASAVPAAWSAALAAFLLGLLGGLVPPVASALVGDVADSAERPSALGAVFFWRDLGVVLVFVVSITRALGGLSLDPRGLFGAFAVLFGVCAVLSAILVAHESRRDTAAHR